MALPHVLIPEGHRQRHAGARRCPEVISFRTHCQGCVECIHDAELGKIALAKAFVDEKLKIKYYKYYSQGISVNDALIHQTHRFKQVTPTLLKSSNWWSSKQPTSCLMSRICGLVRSDWTMIRFFVAHISDLTCCRISYRSMGWLPLRPLRSKHPIQKKLRCWPCNIPPALKSDLQV